jgi:hypothetical protein
MQSCIYADHDRYKEAKQHANIALNPGGEG